MRLVLRAVAPLNGAAPNPEAGRGGWSKKQMRIPFLCLTIAGLLAAAAPESAKADQYKWCALYNFGETGGGANCYFATLEQCQWAVSGVGGFCARSPFEGNLPANAQLQARTPPQPPAQRKRNPS